MFGNHRLVFRQLFGESSDIFRKCLEIFGKLLLKVIVTNDYSIRLYVLYNKQNHTWLYRISLLTSEHSERVRYQVEHS